MSLHARTPCELIHEFPIFASLDDQTCAELFASGQIRRFDRGEILFLEGEPCKGLYLIRSGVVKIFKESESGREQILALLRAGDTVAELPLFDNAPYPASAAAMDNSVILVIPKARFDDLLARRPQLSKALIAALSRRLRSLVELIADLSLRQVRQRLARFVLEEAGGNDSFHLKLTNEELAARLGSVRDVISRTLSGLQADGLIRLNGRHLEIKDRGALEVEAGL
ncbi:MAG: Crp/Fnr family transcriptional regulator [Armatimonadota bacterium]